MARFVMIRDRSGSRIIGTIGHLSAKLNVSDSVGDGILRAQATIIAEEQRKNAGTMLNEKGYGRGYTKESIKVGNVYTRKGVKYIQVMFKGRRPDGKRAAEVAFLNEFGTGHSAGRPAIPARGFIAKANAAVQDEIAEVAADMAAAYAESLLEI